MRCSQMMRSSAGEGGDCLAAHVHAGRPGAGQLDVIAERHQRDGGHRMIWIRQPRGRYEQRRRPEGPRRSDAPPDGAHAAQPPAEDRRNPPREHRPRWADEQRRAKVIWFAGSKTILVSLRWQHGSGGEPRCRLSGLPRACQSPSPQRHISEGFQPVNPTAAPMRSPGPALHAIPPESAPRFLLAGRK